MWVERQNAIREARRAHEYVVVARHVRGKRRQTMIARSIEASRRATKFAETLAGFRSAVISADGLLVVTLRASEAATRYRRGFVVMIEHEIDPREIHFDTAKAAAAFVARALQVPARTCALLLDKRHAPAEQVELFPIHALGVVA